MKIKKRFAEMNSLRIKFLVHGNLTSSYTHKRFNINLHLKHPFGDVPQFMVQTEKFRISTLNFPVCSEILGYRTWILAGC